MSDQERWYRDIRIDAAQQNYPLLLSRLFQGLHACISQFASENDVNNIGIGFPAWNSHGLGPLIRLVSVNPGQLEQIEYEPAVSKLLEHCYIRITPVDKVPEEKVFAEYIYQRNRKPEKLTPAFIQRQNRRQGKRGLPPLPEGYNAKAIQERHFINLLSSESGHRFSLFIKRTDNLRKKVIAPYNRYGLAEGNLEHPPTIPHFNTDWQPVS